MSYIIMIYSQGSNTFYCRQINLGFNFRKKFSFIVLYFKRI